MNLDNIDRSCQSGFKLVCSFLALSVLLFAAPAKAAKFESWKFDNQQNQLEFSTDEGVQPQAQLVGNPTRLVIDLPGVSLGRSAIRESYDGLIRSVRIGQFDRETTRLVIELAPGYTLDPDQIKFRGVSPQHWLVTLPKPHLPKPNLANPNAASVPSSAPGAIVVQTQAVANPAALQPLPPPRPSAPRLSAPRLSAPQPTSSPIPPYNPTLFNAQLPAAPVRQTPEGRVTVLIDPGHGGPDPGAIGIGGLQEKGIVLDISTRIASLLQQWGVQAYLTRNDDRDLGLEPRVQMAAQVNAAVFVSIHANSISLSRPEVNGLETYYFQSGADLARSIHQAVLQGTGVADRGVKSSRFYVLRKTSMPSVLVEVGFVTGRDDAARLANASYRAQMADAIARGIVQYLQRTAKL